MFLHSGKGLVADAVFHAAGVPGGRLGGDPQGDEPMGQHTVALVDGSGDGLSGLGEFQEPLRVHGDIAVLAALLLELVMVEAKEDERVARVVVMDDQLSLAIGREGVNARLAAKLTGWKIDIKPYSAMEQEVKAATERAEQMGSDNFDVFDEDLGELD